FIAPPLSSPRTLKTCSAVRCWTSPTTISAGRPPIRLPRPRAVRPAKPIGSVASLAERVTARRGRVFTIYIVRYRHHCYSHIGPPVPTCPRPPPNPPHPTPPPPPP